MLIASGTFTYFSHSELIELFRVIQKLNIDILINDPRPSFPIANGLQRTKDTYYHNYLCILKELGLKNIYQTGDSGRKSPYFTLYNSYTLERWHFWFASNQTIL